MRSKIFGKQHCDPKNLHCIHWYNFCLLLQTRKAIVIYQYFLFTIKWYLVSALRDHPLITYAKFFENQCRVYQEVRNASFSKNFLNILNGWSSHSCCWMVFELNFTFIFSCSELECLRLIVDITVVFRFLLILGHLHNVLIILENVLD